MVSIGVQINIDDNIDIKKATKAERMRIASAKYNQNWLMKTDITKDWNTSEKKLYETKLLLKTRWIFRMYKTFSIDI